MSLDVLSKEQHSALVKALTEKDVLRLGMKLVEIWSEGWPKKVKALAKANQLIPLVVSYTPALEQAVNLEPDYTHLATHEILELAGLPLQLPQVSQSPISSSPESSTAPPSPPSLFSETNVDEPGE